MKRILHSFYLTLISALMCVLLSALGCAALSGNSWQTVSGKFLTTTEISVDGAMQGWAVLVVKGVATPGDEVTVRNLYLNYQAAFAVATNAYAVAVKVGDSSLFTTPSNTLFGAKTALINKTTGK